MKNKITSTMTSPVSKCCGAPVSTAHGCDADLGHGGGKCDCAEKGGVTMWYECDSCKNPCDIAGEKKVCPKCLGKRIVSSGTPNFHDGHICFECDGTGLMVSPPQQEAGSKKKHCKGCIAAGLTRDSFYRPMHYAPTIEHPLLDTFSSVEDYKEICICAAIKTKDGRIFRGHRHMDCFQAMRYRNIEEPDADQGFVTSQNRFVSREEGRKLQELAGIKSVDKDGYQGNTLFSEDLY